VLCGCGQSTTHDPRRTYQYGCGTTTTPQSNGMGNLIDACPQTTTTTRTVAVACAASRDDCSPDEVIATVRDVYVATGTKTDEAACVAAIEGHGKHALVQLLKPLSNADYRRSIECVASKARLDVMHEALSKYLIENLGR
jgi:hypothetical protein